MSACGLAGPTTFDGRTSSGALTVIDETRTVARVDFSPLTKVEVPLAGVAAVPDAPKKLAIGWVIGGCFGPSRVAITGDAEAIEVAIKAPRCGNESAQFVQVHLVFAQPVDPANVTVEVTHGPVAAGRAARYTG